MATRAEIEALTGRADKLMADAEVLLLKDGASPEEQKEASRLMQEAKGIQLRAEQLDEIRAAGVSRKQFQSRIEEDQARMQAQAGNEEGPDEQKNVVPGSTPAGEGPGEFKSWEEFLYQVWTYGRGGEPDERLVIFRDEASPGEEKQMSGQQGSTGGFLIPSEFYPSLMSVEPEDSIVRPRATIIRIRRRQVSIPILDQTGTAADLPHWFGGMIFYWKGEGDEKVASEPAFRQMQLTAHKLIGLTHASDEMIDDSAIALGDFLNGPLGFRGGALWMEDYAFMNGTGANQPRGVINAPCTIGAPRAAAGTIGIGDIVGMVQRFLPSGRGVWVISQSAMAQIMQLAGPAANPSYFWQPSARDGVPGYLFGYPVIWSEKVPALGTRGDIGLYDFRYYLLGDRQRTTVDSTNKVRWIYDETSWRMVHRVDGRPWLSTWLTFQDGQTEVSPFVVLGAQSTS